MELDRLLRRSEVEKRVGLTRSAIYALMRKSPPEFPLPIKIGPKAVRWSLRELEQWLSTRPRAAGEHREAA